MDLEFNSNSRILILTPETFPSYAGFGISAYRFGKFISKKGIKVRLCHLNYNFELPLNRSDEELKIFGIPYFNKSFITKLVSFPIVFSAYIYFLIKSDIVIIYSGFLIGFQLIILFGRLFGKKIIFRPTTLKVDDTLALKRKGLIIGTFSSYAISKASLFFSINPEITRKLKITHPTFNRILESYQGIDGSVFFSSSRRKNFISVSDSNKLFNILSVGYLFNRKGYGTIIHALNDSKFPFKYTVAGDYELRKGHRFSEKEKLEMSQIYKFGKDMLGEKIHFTGAVNNISHLYHQSDVLIHAANKEGTPNVILEAMACGIPVVCKTLGGVTGELIQNEVNGFIFNTVDELHMILNKLYNDDDLRYEIGHRASLTISENYTFEKVFLKLTKCLISRVK